MKEMMIDLETKDTIPSAVILSIGAVVWDTEMSYPMGESVEKGTLEYTIVERFYRHPSLVEQEGGGPRDVLRTQSADTMRWWSEQDRDAYDEAFTQVRQPVEDVWRDLTLLAASHGITRFWASPCTFDFPILNDFQRDFGLNAIWGYNQMFDVRTVVLEANYSARDHVPLHEIAGKAHMPVTDCEWQIDLLTAARRKLGRRMGS